MFHRWAGPLITMLILGGVALIVLLNLNWPPSAASRTPGQSPSIAPSASAVPDRTLAKPPAPRPGAAGFREYPIGEDVEKNHMRIAAVWLPPIEMEGMIGMAGPSSSDVIHLEADIHATEGNPNGFAKDEFVPYLKIHYEIRPTGGGEPIHQGELIPMIARDGLHYGASVAMPKPGRYQLLYDLQPPSSGGLGRHSDPITGVDPWWKPLRVAFDWDYPGPPGP
jgi:uncharacterized protein involved in high-affinity Fe2+ transport